MRSHTVSLCAIVGCLGAACGLDSQGLGLRALDGGGSQANEAGTIIASVGGGADVGSSVGNDGSGGAVNGESGAATGESGVTGIVGTDSGGGVSTSDGSLAAVEAGAPCGVCPQGQQCDPTLGCVTCTMDSQCPASARYCLLGSCVQCKTNAQCGGTTPSCWPATNVCHAACTSNQQCSQDGTAPLCDTATGACVGCNSSADCPTSQRICHPTTQQCVQCAASADCAGTSTPACLRNLCVQCATNADCAAGTPYCVTSGDSPGRCVQCLQNAQCPPSTPSCNSGTCGKSGG